MKQKTHNKTEAKEIVKSGRREFLARSWKWLGMIALAEVAFLTVNMLSPAKKKKEIAALAHKIAGSIEDFPVNSVTPDRVSKYYLVRTDDGGFIALSLICSHLGCSVLWDETKGQFICPCHSSAFDRLGNVINSPAPRALDYYPVIIEEGKVKVDLTQKKKRKKLNKTQVTYAI